jgi:hypothetical protein
MVGGARTSGMSEPQLSVVLMAGTQRARTRRALEALQSQTVAGRIELVLVDCAPETEQLDLPAELGWATVAPQPVICGLGEARAAGARAAKGPIVAFLVDHCYPAPGWAEALVAAYGGPWAAVGYSFGSANPGSYVNRTAILAQFGPWLEAAGGGAVGTLPGLNVSYRREVLMEIDGELGRLLEIDLLLHERMRKRGLELGFEPRAVVVYESFGSVLETALANHAYSEQFAAQRARAGRWPGARRLLYGLASPLLVTALRLAATARETARRPRKLPHTTVALPGILAIALMAALGEARGYLLGARGTHRRILRWELHAPRACGPESQTAAPS